MWLKSINWFHRLVEVCRQTSQSYDLCTIVNRHHLAKHLFWLLCIHRHKKCLSFQFEVSYSSQGNIIDLPRFSWVRSHLFLMTNRRNERNSARRLMETIPPKSRTQNHWHHIFPYRHPKPPETPRTGLSPLNSNGLYSNFKTLSHNLGL